MAYYQVLLSLDSGPLGLRQVLVDLSEEDLGARLLVPYRRGTGMVCGNEIVPTLQIRRIYVVRTARPNQIERDLLRERSVQEIRAVNGPSENLTLVTSGGGYDPEDIFEVGEDVTAKYISSPAGSGSPPSLIETAINHPWTVTVVGGLVLVIAVWWLGYGR